VHGVRSQVRAVTAGLRSDAFSDGGTIPRRYTCDGQDLIPPLGWSDLPAETVEVAILVDDPDAPGGTFTHWVVWGLDPSEGGVREGQVPEGAGQGSNDFGRFGYGGPCPPRGQTHRYFFTLFALAEELSLKEGASADDLKAAVKGKVLEQAQLMGRFGH
jgi:Raf kinase inhibitor-like YbhB/YbcL family protein